MHPALAHHRKHHKIDGWLPRIADCFRCTEDRFNCENKIIYKTRKAADKKAERINVSVNWAFGRCKRPYRCRWCSLWHLTSEATELDYIRIEKMRQRWLRRNHLKDNQGWINDVERGDRGIPA